MTKRPAAKNYSKLDATYQESMNAESEKSIDDLSLKIDELKNISIGIRGYINNEKKILNDIEGDYTKTDQMMNFTMKKLDVIMNSKAGRISCYLTMFVVFFLLLLWTLG